jgi:hypothetical protein
MSNLMMGLLLFGVFAGIAIVLFCAGVGWAMMRGHLDELRHEGRL